jgi:hypothetical protein
MTQRFAVLLLTLTVALGAAAQSIGDKSLFVGGDVRIEEASNGNVSGAGGHVVVNAPVAGKLRIAGGDVEIGPNATIAEDVAVAGGTVTVKGNIGGTLRAAGGNITIDGVVRGDAVIAGGNLELGPNARIGGQLRYRGGNLRQDPAAQVAGGIQHRTGNRHAREHKHGAAGAIAWAFWTIGLMVLAALVAGALPGPTQRLTRELVAHPWTAPLLGFIALTCIPIAAVLVMATIIGIPLGILALLAYALLLLVGYVWTSVVLGGLLLDRVKPEVAGRTAWRVGAAVIAMLAVAAFARIPFIGGWIMFAALLVGVGMITGALLRRTPPAPAA